VAAIVADGVTPHGTVRCSCPRSTQLPSVRNSALEIAAKHGCHPLRGVATYEDVYKLTYLRGPSGILVMFPEELKKEDLPRSALGDTHSSPAGPLEAR
jgi:hypothetical protein